MDKFVKRKAPTDAGADGSKKQAKKPRPVFVVAPGAGGGDCAQLTSALATMGRCVPIGHGGRWMGNSPKNLDANVELVEAAAQKAADVADAGPVILVGHSFGCRVVAELLARQAADKTLPDAVVVGGAILESYPLYGPKPPTEGTDRAAQIAALPSGSKVLFVSGSKDEFLDRSTGKDAWRGADDATGPAALEAVVAEASCAATFEFVQGAKHNAFSAPKSSQDSSRRAIIAAIKMHVDALR